MRSLQVELGDPNASVADEVYVCIVYTWEVNRVGHGRSICCCLDGCSVHSRQTYRPNQSYQRGSKILVADWEVTLLSPGW